MNYLIAALLLLLSLASMPLSGAPATFTEAKAIAKRQVYFDQAGSDLGELYCGCKWTWMGKSGGRVDFGSCGYEPRIQKDRAKRIEWEHIVPAWQFGHQRQCWQNGGRKNCQATDRVFRVMEADVFNLYPSVGEVNADRSNYKFGMVAGHKAQYGACTTRTDFSGKVAEPRDQAKGLIARTAFYMHDRYGLSMSRQQQQLLMAWSKQHPISDWERERDIRIAAVMGHNNPFVTGERTWTIGYKPRRDGVTRVGVPKTERFLAVARQEATASDAIIGNRNSKVYHLPQGCPSYTQVSSKNQVFFGSEVEAAAAGYRKAGNCS